MAERAWDVLRAAAAGWLGGETYEELAVTLVGDDARGNAARHQRAPLPKVIRVVNEVLGFGLTRAVGGLVALHQAGSRAGDERWDLATDESRDALELAPLAVRYGCGDLASLAWARFAQVPRRLAHLVSRNLEAPPDLSDAALMSWVATSLTALAEGSPESDWSLAPIDQDALSAWRRLLS
jgi:hypothetical protein